MGRLQTTTTSGTMTPQPGGASWRPSNDFGAEFSRVAEIVANPSHSLVTHEKTQKHHTRHLAEPFPGTVTQGTVRFARSELQAPAVRIGLLMSGSAS